MPGTLNPGALAVDFQADAGNENDHQQQQAENIKRGSDVQQFAIIVKSDQQHGDDRNAKTDQLFDPKVFSRLRVTNLNGAKADDADGQYGEQPVKIAQQQYVIGNQ